MFRKLTYAHCTPDWFLLNVYVQVLFLKVHTHFYLLYTLDIWKGYVLNFSMFPCMCYICLFPCLELSKHPNCLHKPEKRTALFGHQQYIALHWLQNYVTSMSCCLYFCSEYQLFNVKFIDTKPCLTNILKSKTKC